MRRSERRCVGTGDDLGWDWEVERLRGAFPGLWDFGQLDVSADRWGAALDGSVRPNCSVRTYAEDLRVRVGGALSYISKKSPALFSTSTHGSHDTAGSLLLLESFNGVHGQDRRDRLHTHAGGGPPGARTTTHGRAHAQVQARRISRVRACSVTHNGGLWPTSMSVRQRRSGAPNEDGPMASATAGPSLGASASSSSAPLPCDSALIPASDTARGVQEYASPCSRVRITASHYIYPITYVYICIGLRE